MAYEDDMWLGGPFRTLSLGNRTTKRGNALLGEDSKTIFILFYGGCDLFCGRKGREGSFRSSLIIF
jgi:hypothetical protein